MFSKFIYETSTTDPQIRLKEAVRI